MALANYADLLASVASYLKRSDLTANIPDFVALAEARISRDLRIRKQITNATLTTTPGSRTVALPSDWLELEDLSVNTSPARNLSYRTIEQLDAKFPANDYTGTPTVYTIEGDSLLLGPAPDTAYAISLIYYARFPALGTVSVNWLMTNHPGVYLFATLLESAPFIANDERMQVWNAKYSDESKALQQQDDRAAHSGSMLRVTVI